MTTRPVVTTVVLALVTVAMLATVARAGGGADAPGGVRTIELTARHSRFTPARVVVEPGTTVRFVVRNLDPIDHEIIVGGPEVHQRHEVGREAHHHGDVPGEVTVPAGATATTTYRAPRSGSLLFACHIPGHFAYGMQGVLVVS